MSVEETEEEAEERSAHKQAWWRDGWKAEPTPAPKTTPKLIPIVTTAKAADPLELVRTYTRRWPAQENIIRDFLLPLGLDINHGYGKQSVENSEASKRRAALSKRLSNIQKWAVSASVRAHRASKLYSRLWKETKLHGEQLYRVLNQRLWELDEQGMHSYQLRQVKRELVDKAEAELAPLWQRVYRTLEQSNKEHNKCEHYAHEQCDVLRALEELSQHERGMYELDNRKDHIMTVCKLALANLVMWTRDHYFPTTYEHATWKRLAPFFQLPGRVVCHPTVVAVELRSFNDRQLNRDLLLICQRVNQKQPHLPDGRLLSFIVKAHARPNLDGQQCQIA